MLSPPVLTGII